jgi:hypothetical protein
MGPTFEAPAETASSVQPETNMKRLAIVVLALLPYAPIRAQALIAGDDSGGGAVRLLPSDAAVLEVHEVKTSLPCAITPARTEMGFDLVFHAGHTARVKLRDLEGAGNVLTSIFRVTPLSNPDKTVYFEQKWRVPPIPADAAGVASLDSSFTVGEGDYQVAWLLRDRNERVCSAFWKTSARIAIKDGHVTAGLPPGSVSDAGSDSYAGEDASRSDLAQRLSVMVLLKVGPQVAGGASISQTESDALLSILRGILREPRIGEISITAFNLEQRQVIFEQEHIRQVNFASLKKAIGSLTVGTVTFSQLAEKDGEARFLIRLAAERTERKHSDALIFVGPKTLDEAGMTRDLLKQLGDARCPVFYLTYLPTPNSNPWRDLIGSAVRQWRGREFTISKPDDLVSAWSKIMSQLGSNGWRAAER